MSSLFEIPNIYMDELLLYLSADVLSQSNYMPRIVKDC
jgi:hypothetical protein